MPLGKDQPHHALGRASQIKHVDTIGVCDDCYIGNEYGAENAVDYMEEGPDRTNRIAEIGGGLDRYTEGGKYSLHPNSDEYGDNEGYFSKSSCPTCDSGLGGNRYDVNVLHHSQK